MPKYFVISGNHDQFSEWRRRNGTEMLLNRQIENVSDIVYVSGPESIKGVSNPTGIFIGTWYNRSDIVSILQTLHTSVSGDKLDSIHKAWNYLKEVT